MATKKTDKPDLNEATKEELVEVAGLKPAAADTIVKLRDEQGPIDSLEQLRSASRIGKADIGKLQDSFVVAAKPARETAQDATRKGSEAAKKAADAGPARKAGDAGKDTARHGAEAGQRVREASQAATRQTGEAAKKAIETGQDMARRGGEATRRVAETVQEATRQGGESVKKVAETTQEWGQRGAETAQRMGEALQEGTQDVVGRMAEASRGLEGAVPLARIGLLWMSFWPEQAAQGAAAASRLLQCRSLPEMIQVQSEFAMGSLDRLARCVTSTTTEMAANQGGRSRKAA